MGFLILNRFWLLYFFNIKCKKEPYKKVQYIQFGLFAIFHQLLNIPQKNVKFFSNTEIFIKKMLQVNRTTFIKRIFSIRFQIL